MTNLREIARVLRHRDFRLLWLAQSTSVVGDNIVLVALSLFVIQRTHNATDLGIVLAAQALPLVAFLLIGGVWADRLPRHLVMVVTDLMRFALHALLAALIFAGRVPIWQLVVIEMLFRGAEAFFRPAANGLLPRPSPRTTSSRPPPRPPSPKTSPSSPAPHSPPRSSSAPAPAGRSRSTPPPSSSAPRCSCACVRARARLRRSRGITRLWDPTTRPSRSPA